MQVEDCCQALLAQILPTIDEQREGICVDIGVGTFAFYCEVFAKLGFQTVAVEPLPIDVLRQLCSRHKINLIEACVSEVSGSQTLHIGTFKGSENINLSSLESDWWGSSKKTVKVQSLTLSQVLSSVSAEKVTCIKIDVEGAELRIIRQFASLPKSLLPDVVMFEYGGGDRKEGGQKGWSEKFVSATYECLQIVKDSGYASSIIIDSAKEANEIIFNLQSSNLDTRQIFPKASVYGNIIAIKGNASESLKIDDILEICAKYKDETINRVSSKKLPDKTKEIGNENLNKKQRENFQATGEKSIIDRLIQSKDIVFDVGANTGSWTQAVLNSHSDVKIHLFEPVPQTYQSLLHNISDRLKTGNIFPNNLAMGSVEKLQKFYFYEEKPAWSTFFRRFDVEKQYGIKPPKSFLVLATSLEIYCKQWGIERINLLKIDVEGGELDVLHGCGNLLKKGQIDYLQFEYGGTFLDAKITLQEVFEYLQKNRYSLFKISPKGLEYKPIFGPEYEDYSYSNFLAVNERFLSTILGEQPKMLDITSLCQKHSVKPRGVIHIGAYEGKEVTQYQLMGAEKTLFIEANPVVFERLQGNIAGYPKARAVNCAVSNIDGTSTMYLTSLEQSSSILPLKKVKEHYPDIRETDKITVKTRRLDTLLQELELSASEFNIINLDIQGAELLALEGATNLLKHIDAINTEVNYEELYEGCALIEQIDDFLEQQGFERVATTTPYHPSWGDAFYVRKPVITMSTLGRNGRFANQLFQYAFLKIYARERDLRVETPAWIGQFLFGHNDPPISKQLPVVEEKTNDLATAKVPHARPTFKNVDFWGYFQYNSKYYAPHKDYFRSLFKPIPEIENGMQEVLRGLRLRGKTIIGLHLRRGDYGYAHFFVAPTEWYKEWLKGLWETLEEPVLFIASDELEKVVGDFAEYNPVTCKQLGLELPQAEFYPDFYLLSQCDIVAISNSSFSFAACMLNEKGKLFFRPHLPSKKLIPFDPWSSETIFIKWQLKTPVCLIIFNRPDTTEKVFEAIREAKPPKLFVIADGPRSEKPGEAEKCAAARAIINRVDWDCEVFTNYSTVNLGCRKRISTGLTWLFEMVEEAIILEDDCLPHPTFFRFCQELLERYRDDKRIMVISGDNFQSGNEVIEHSYYFSIYPHCWGWATWRRAWQQYDNEMKVWSQLPESNWLQSLLLDSQAISYWSNIFNSVYNAFDTWDYVWVFCCWINNGLSILPKVNLVSNIGCSSDATHTITENVGSKLANIPVEAMNFPQKHPPFVIRNIQADNFTEKTIFSGSVPNQVPKEARTSLVEIAVKQLNANNNAEALRIFEKASASLPELDGIYYGKAVAQARIGQINEAIESLQCLLAKVPNHLKGKQLLAELNKGSQEKVQEMLAEVVKLLEAGKKVEALRLVEKAASLDIFVSGLHYLRAICSSEVGRYEEALEAARQELVNNPSHIEAQKQVEALSKALTKPKRAAIPTDKRSWNTSLPHELMMSIQNAIHNYSYQDVPLQKNPFDFAIYPLLIWKLKPRTIIEIGSKSGGSALWFADLLNNFGIDGHIYSVDVVRVSKFSHPRVSFMEGDGQALQETFSEEFIKRLPRPLLVIEDADHSLTTSKSVLDFFHPYLDEGEYIVIEDGIISDILQDATYNSGPHQALKAFLAEHRGEYEIDGEYCDFFAYNLTWATNGYLKKLTKATVTFPNQLLLKEIRPGTVGDLMQQATQALNNDRINVAFNLLNKAKSLKQPTLGLDYLRATCFMKMNQVAAAGQSLNEELRYFPSNAEAKNLRNQIQEQHPQLNSGRVEDAEFQELFQVIRPYTMLSEARLYSLFSLAKRVCLENIPGNFVECGVAAGGSTALMAAVIKRYTKQPRWLLAFDSFEGMPSPTEADKSYGISADLTGWGTGTCAAPEASTREICSQLGVGDIVQTVKGYFQDTLPVMQNRVGMLALLHMDGDWYESTQAILNNLYDRVSDRAFVQVDDYGHWEGCRQALHEFESDRQLKFDFNQIDDTGVWFQCRNKFPINPAFESALVQEFQEDDPVAYGIQSQMSRNERFQLYYSLRQLLPETPSPLRFIEIGSFAGSSLFLNYRALKRSHTQIEGFAIDPGLHPQLQQVLQQFPDEVTHLKMFSHQALAQLQQLCDRDGNLPPFIFVDGDHTYEGVRQDIIDYFPLLAPGGIMVFHDYLPPLNEENREAILFHHGGKEPGIRQACQELMENEYSCEQIEIPPLYPTDPTQSQAYLPIIPGVFSTVKVYRKPDN